MARTLIFCALLTLATTCFSKAKLHEHMRCGQSILELGMTEQKVLKKCFPKKPVNRHTFLRWNVPHVQYTFKEWGKFRRYIIFRNGRAIEFITGDKRN